VGRCLGLGDGGVLMSEEKLVEKFDGCVYIDCRMCLKLETGLQALGAGIRF